MLFKTDLFFYLYLNLLFNLPFYLAFLSHLYPHFLFCSYQVLPYIISISILYYYIYLTRNRFNNLISLSLFLHLFFSPYLVQMFTLFISTQITPIYYSLHTHTHTYTTLHTYSDKFFNKTLRFC